MPGLPDWVFWALLAWGIFVPVVPIGLVIWYNIRYRNHDDSGNPNE